MSSQPDNARPNRDRLGSTHPATAELAVGGFCARRTRRLDLDALMPVRSRDDLAGTPFFAVSPMPYRIGVLLACHFSSEFIAAELHLSAGSVKTYAKRFRESLRLGPPAAYQLALAWGPFLTEGWVPRFSVFGDDQFGDAA